MLRRRNLIHALKLILFVAITVSASYAQVRPINDQGALGLGQMLKRLNTTGSVMMIGAHPDDEDSALLAYLARGENARTAYLSLTRGDGGQNIIGPELFEALGVIRTEELLQARRLDGAQQYFTRAFDYGFSKTLAEAKSKWDEKIILCDTVRAIRTFRPMVVISRFSGTSADGHGQHQYAGYISPLAVRAAADAGQCSGAGPAWRVLKFYKGQGFAPNSPATLRLNTGQWDPILGRTYFEIAMEGRSQHRSQGEGRTEFHGDQFSGLNLVEADGPPVAAEKSIFDGIDTSITGIATVYHLDGSAPIGSLASVEKAARTALGKFDPYHPDSLLPLLLQGAAETRTAIEAIQDTHAKLELANKYGQFVKAIRYAVGLQIDALSDKETIVPGESAGVSVKVYTRPNSGVTVKDIVIESSAGFPISKAEAPKDNTSGFNKRETAPSSDFFSVKVPSQADLTQPYWLKNPREGDLFPWPGNADQNQPFQPPLLTAKVNAEINGVPITFDEPVMFRLTDPARGELRRDISVVPTLAIAVDRDLVVVPVTDKDRSAKLTIGITNNADLKVIGVARINIDAPNEWKYTVNSAAFSLKNKGDKATIVFEITVPAGTTAGQYTVSFSAVTGEVSSGLKMNTVAYPHIQTHRFYVRAETSVRVLDLKLPPLNVGYIMGSGDQVDEAARRMGAVVAMLDEQELASGQLSKYETIVVGIRASETRPDFVANNARLLEYVNNGGNLIVQYQRPSFADLHALPFPATLGPRVVDENARVTILEPGHSVFNYPNKITDKDFEGWVQERNLYNFNTFDPKYVPLLESHDAGEPENKGGLVIAKVGKGTYVYCSYSFFRQLPAGVSGAYRLFANLLSIPKAGN